jgi:nucleoporin SEH1
MQPAMIAVGCGKEHVAKVFRTDAYHHWQPFEILNGHGGIIRDISWAPNMGRFSVVSNLFLCLLDHTN